MFTIDVLIPGCGKYGPFSDRRSAILPRTVLGLLVALLTSSLIPAERVWWEANDVFFDSQLWSSGRQIQSRASVWGEEVSFEAGKTYYGRERYIEYQSGKLPIIIVAPHGGRIKPNELPDREQGVFAVDVNTQELARAVAQQLQQDTGQPVHLVICRLHRKKIDCNRELEEGAGNHPLTKQSWNEYHRYIETGCKAVVTSHQRGLLIDLHGHGHALQHIELGYLHSRKELLVDDAGLNRVELMTSGSLKALMALPTRVTYAELLRGPTSMGGLLQKEGLAATPSPQIPQPPLPYFSGLYTLQRHARDAGPMCGVQMETHWKELRDTEQSRDAFACKFVPVLRAFLLHHLKLELPTDPKK